VKTLQSLGRLEIEKHPPLVAIDSPEHHPAVLVDGPEAPVGISGSRLNLGDISAEIGELEASKRAGYVGGDLDHTDARQGWCQLFDFLTDLSLMKW
jgi:hypothetical protein